MSSLFDIIPISLILLSLSVIIIIVIKKFSALANLDLNSIKAERESMFKKKIINDRLKRGLLKWNYQIKKLSGPTFSKVGEFYKGLYEKLSIMKETHKISSESAGDNAEIRVAKMYSEAEDLYKNEEYDKAEERLIEIIGLDSQNIRAFKKLGKVYFDLKSYAESIQTLEHLLKLLENKIRLNQDELEEEVGGDKDIDVMLSGIYFDLALAYFENENTEKASEVLMRALQIEPNNPRYLDTMLEISIMKKDKKMAEEMHAKLKESNPENNKIEEFEKRIEGLE